MLVQNIFKLLQRQNQKNNLNLSIIINQLIHNLLRINKIKNLWNNDYFICINIIVVNNKIKGNHHLLIKLNLKWSIWQ